MVLLELSVISTIAWFLGYLLAMAAVPVVLASAGSMQFEPLSFTVNPKAQHRCYYVHRSSHIGSGVNLRKQPNKGVHGARD